ncbi:hypothetical protein DXA66_04690 [Faecalibacterium sp. OF03-6AC]|uniref:hypothetical protein n=1 Tax=Faecalibacterium TaxID=216851 RepID=UPI000E4D1FD1|nr:MULTISPECIES: hypothetical protein [Faecalibacterium]RHP63878.1 hypothetical protein DXA66_04690 [Faecalibacterium sp. OF03-6AC]
MIDLKLNATGDLDISAAGDISSTDSIIQAVRIRLLWFFGEWRLMPSLGFPYFENLLVKNPNESKLRHLIRETVMSVDGVKDVTDISFDIDKKNRSASVAISFTTDEDRFREEIRIPWQNMA